MKKLKYTTRVINESLRLYPQPPVLIRRSIENDVLGKYPIKRTCSIDQMDSRKLMGEPSVVSKLQDEGEDIFISVWNLHRSPSLWQDAEKFNPERWPLDGPNPNETNQNFCYLPFGGGPRKCVGDMFASFETVVAVAMLIRRFNFQMALGAPPVEMTTGATIHTTQGLKMTVTRRMKPPIIPEINMEGLKMEGTARILEAETQVGEKDMDNAMAMGSFVALEMSWLEKVLGQGASGSEYDPFPLETLPIVPSHGCGKWIFPGKISKLRGLREGAYPKAVDCAWISLQTSNLGGNRGLGRMAVYIDLGKPLVSQILVNGVVQKIEFESLSFVYFSCGRFGHMKDLCLGIGSTKDTDVGKELTVSDSPEKDKVVELTESFGTWMLVDRKSWRNSIAHQSLVTRVTENGALNLIGTKMTENGVVATNLLEVRFQKGELLKVKGQGNMFREKMNDGSVAKDFNAFGVLRHDNLAGLGTWNGVDCLVDIGPGLRDISKQNGPTLDYPDLGIEASGNFKNSVSIGLDQPAPRGVDLELSIILGNFMVLQGG
ncbi:hypothetical protein GOBAR_DD30430 [Gossypium barbadense]|nr:hypothetical protein GOBAR_DD30430 [Gossypium barbadense]